MIYKFNLVITMLFTSITLFSQTRAVTEYGDTIYIYNNGTWAYEILEDMPDENLLDYLKVDLQVDSIKEKNFFNPSAKKTVTNKGQIVNAFTQLSLTGCAYKLTKNN